MTTVPSSLSPPQNSSLATSTMRPSQVGYFNGTNDIMPIDKYTDIVNDADLVSSSYLQEEESQQKYNTKKHHFPPPPITTPDTSSAKPRKKSKKSNHSSPQQTLSPFRFGSNGNITIGGIGVGSSTRKKPTPKNNNNSDTTER